MSSSVGEKTQFKPGVSGNPSGRPKKKLITDDIMAELEKDPDLLKKIARNLLKRSTKLDTSFTALRDTIEGKPTQAISGPDDGPIPLSIEAIDEALLKLVEAAEERKPKE